MSSPSFRPSSLKPGLAEEPQCHHTGIEPVPEIKRESPEHMIHVDQHSGDESRKSHQFPGQAVTFSDISQRLLDSDGFYVPKGCVQPIVKKLFSQTDNFFDRLGSDSSRLIQTTYTSFTSGWFLSWRGSFKSSIIIGVSITNHPAIGVPAIYGIPMAEPLEPLEPLGKRLRPPSNHSNEDLHREDDPKEPPGPRTRNTPWNGASSEI